MVRISLLLNILAYVAALTGFLPLRPYLDLPVQVLFVIGFGLGIVSDRRDRHVLSGWPATLLSLAGVIFYLLQIRRDLLVEPVVQILTLLLAIRLATPKQGRDYLQIFVLAMFALAGSSLLSLDLSFFFYLLLQVCLICAGLVLLAFFASDPAMVLTRRQARPVLGIASLFPIASLLLMVGFFFILPRTQQPLWNFLNRSPVSQTGFSDKVAPGSVADMASSRNVVMRVQSPQLAPEDLYWRSIVLNRLDGLTWSRRNDATERDEHLRGGRRIAQTLFPEPQTNLFMTTLDGTSQVSGIRLKTSADNLYLLRRPLKKRIALRADAFPGSTLQPAIPFAPSRYLEVPNNLSQRLLDTGRQIKEGDATAEERIRRLESVFRDQKLTYATSDLPTGPQALESFLFEKRRGYCEFFASSFALLLRLADVPSRLVGGYWGGEYNAIGGYYLVTEDRAHVWVEAYVKGKGWLRIDPTLLAVNSPEDGRSLAARGLNGWQSFLDTIEYQWNQTVITYDLHRQLDALRQTGKLLRDKTAGRQKKSLLMGGGIIIVLVAAGIWLRQRHPLRNRRERLLRCFLQRVRQRHDLAEIPSSLGLFKLAEQLNDPQIARFVTVYGAAIYQDRDLTREEWNELREILRKMK